MRRGITATAFSVLMTLSVAAGALAASPASGPKPSAWPNPEPSAQPSVWPGDAAPAADPTQRVRPHAAPAANPSGGANPSAAPSAAPATKPSPTAVRNWIVTVDKGVNARTVAPDWSKKSGGKAGRVFEHALHGFVFNGTEAEAKALAKKAGIRRVVPDGKVHITAETIPPGIARIRAEHSTAQDAHDQGFLGVGARVAVLDTGVDLTHPDLVANLDISLDKNCYSSGPPQDGHGHGTHVAGIIAAQRGNNIGVVGVAPSARIVPIKVLSDTGTGEWSNVICGIDYITGLALDSDPNNDVDVVNMSLGDTGDIGNCTDGGMREAICKSVAAGVVYVTASGNSFTDASTFIPAAFPEVITVSAMTDFDGEPGGLAGCQFILPLFSCFCDDEIANFANFGSTIEVTAPGVNVYSTWKGGTYQNESGTSMAAPHVAGVAALVRAANQALTPAQVRDLIIKTGDLPTGGTAESGCASATQWPGDTDGQAEPLVNALRAAQRAVNPSSTPYPIVTLTPADGSTVSGVVALSATASHASGIANVEFFVDNVSVGIDTSAPYSASWNTAGSWDGEHFLSIRATPNSGQVSCQTNKVIRGTLDQGNWYGKYGHDGYILGAYRRAGHDRSSPAPERDADPREGRPLQLGLADDRRPGPRGSGLARATRAPRHILVRHRPAQAAARLHGRLHRHPPRLHLRLGFDDPAPEHQRDRGRIDDHDPDDELRMPPAAGCTSRSPCRRAASSGSPATGSVAGRRRSRACSSAGPGSHRDHRHRRRRRSPSSRAAGTATSASTATRSARSTVRAPPIWWPCPTRR